MSNEITFDRTLRKGVNEVRNVAINFSKLLFENETISTVSVTQATLTITNGQTNTTGMKIEGKSVGIGKAITFTVTAATGVVGTTYPILISFTTSGGQTVNRYLNMEIITQG